MNHRAITQLYDVARTQGGYFSARQAAVAGYSRQAQYHHVQQGNWEKMDRGIFKLSDFQLERFPDVPYWYVDSMPLILWTCDSSGKPRGVFSHETAFTYFPYSVWVPLHGTHLTVPEGFRKRASRPARASRLILHRAALAPGDVMKLGYIPVTKPVRTYVDTSKDGSISDRYWRDYMKIALHIGFVIHDDFLTANLNDEEWLLLLELLESIKYGRLEDLRIARPVQKGA